MKENAPIECVAVIGLGLIGGSVAWGLRQSGLTKRVAAFDRNPLALEYGLSHGFITHKAGSALEAAQDADIVVLAIPPSSLAPTMEALKPALKERAVVTDTASVKRQAIDAVTPHLPKSVAFMPAHPIAGSELSGIAACKADLFAGRRVMLTPLSPEAPGIEPVSRLWQALGARVEFMPPDLHDRVYAYVSHLPHWLALALKSSFAPYLPYASKQASFGRFLRIFQSDAQLWRDIFAANAAHLDEAIARYMLVLAQIRAELGACAAGEGGDVAPPEQIHTLALPQIIASCLIAAVTQEERQMGFGFHRFAGSGFADFTAPAQGAPEERIGFIAQHAAQVAEALDAVLFSLTEQIAQ